MLRKDLPAYASKVPKGDIPGWLVKLIAMVNPPAKQIIPELNRERHISSAKATRLLGWQPRTAEEAIIAGAKSLIDHKAV